MKIFSKIGSLLLIALLSSLFPTAIQHAQSKDAPRVEKEGLRSLPQEGQGARGLFQAFMSRPKSADPFLEPISSIGQGGIKEEIPDKFRGRYETWKHEFLSTET